MGTPDEGPQKNEERFRLAAQAGKMFAYEWDAATGAITRTGECLSILGVDEETPITAEQVLTKVHPEDREKLTSTFAQLSPEKPQLQIAYRMVRPSGDVIWVERHSLAHFDEKGKLVRVVGMIADITRRKLAEDGLAGMSRKLIEAQDQERTRIARELHDDINQRLALLTVELRQLRELLPAWAFDLRTGVDELEKQTDEISSAVQNLSRDLHSSKLESLGIVEAMRDFCLQFGAKYTVQVFFVHEGISLRVPPDISLCLFRVLQESLRNALKHSGVSRFDVSLHILCNEIRFVVRDAGVGFDPELTRSAKGLGLISMRERVNLVKGTFSIKSKLHGGTEINVCVPVATDSQKLD
jgi:PAS domain S-box-containing protein